MDLKQIRHEDLNDTGLEKGNFSYTLLQLYFSLTSSDPDKFLSTSCFTTKYNKTNHINVQVLYDCSGTR
jgi:hypothetical protein